MSTTVNHPSLPQFPTRRELLNWLESNNEDVPEVFNLGNDGSRDEPTDPPDLLISYFRANFSFFPSVRANHWREYTFAGDRVVLSVNADENPEALGYIRAMEIVYNYLFAGKQYDEKTLSRYEL